VSRCCFAWERLYFYCRPVRAPRATHFTADVPVFPRRAGLSRYFFFGGGDAFTGAGLASFFGFFFSLPCELLPLPITLPFVRKREPAGRTPPYAIATGPGATARSFAFFPVLRP
jgi:hypothetical protein